jgi:transcriptional regulator with XRE-family HTH domain
VVSFGEALRGALSDRSMSQQALAHQLGLSSQSVVSQWISGTHEPSPGRVFAIEQVLDLAPGQLSRLLGYLPLEAEPVMDLPGAVAIDPTLTDQQRQAILALYDVLRSTDRASRRRR